MFVELIFRTRKKSFGLSINKKNIVATKYFLKISGKNSLARVLKYNFFLKYFQSFRALHGKGKNKIKHINPREYRGSLFEFKKNNFSWKRAVQIIESKKLPENKILPANINYKFSGISKFNVQNDLKRKKTNFFLEKINLKAKNNLFNLNCLIIKKT